MANLSPPSYNSSAAGFALFQGVPLGMSSFFFPSQLKEYGFSLFYRSAWIPLSSPSIHSNPPVRVSFSRCKALPGVTAAMFPLCTPPLFCAVAYPDADMAARSPLREVFPPPAYSTYAGNPLRPKARVAGPLVPNFACCLVVFCDGMLSFAHSPTRCRALFRPILPFRYNQSHLLKLSLFVSR